MIMQAQLKCDFCSTLTPVCAGEEAAKTWALAHDWVLLTCLTKTLVTAWCDPICQARTTIKDLKAVKS